MAVKRPAAVLILGAASLVVLCLYQALPPGNAELRSTMLAASRLTARAAAAVRAAREAKGAAVDAAADVNRTGLIGVESSGLTTSLGDLEAKRTSTNPDFAGLLVRLFREAGARRGDVAAVGASSSFPGLVLATLAACRALDLEPVAISSLGASQWGANDPAFSWLDMAGAVTEAGVFDARPVAATLGGDGDVGLDMSDENRAMLRAAVRALGRPLIEEGDLATDVARRMDIYDAAARGRRIVVFVNIGGNLANLGADPAVLRLEAGLAKTVPAAAPGQGGVIHAMASRGVPVIHLLHVAGLCRRYDLPWDPRPLPGPGEGGLAGMMERRDPGRLVIAAVWTVLVLALLAILNSAASPIGSLDK
jgi:poly-gamma-glutamate system protein